MVYKKPRSTYWIHSVMACIVLILQAISIVCWSWLLLRKETYEEGLVLNIVWYGKERLYFFYLHSQKMTSIYVGQSIRLLVCWSWLLFRPEKYEEGWVLNMCDTERKTFGPLLTATEDNVNTGSSTSSSDQPYSFIRRMPIPWMRLHARPNVPWFCLQEARL